MGTAAAPKVAKNMQTADREYESISSSVRKLSLAFVIAAVFAITFEQSDFAPTWSLASKHFVWNIVPDATPHVAVGLYFLMVIYHNYFRSQKSRDAAKAWADAEGSPVTACLISWNYFLA